MGILHLGCHALKSSLQWLGRQGTLVAAASIFVGLSIPPLAAVLRPVFAVAIFLLLVFAFLRVDPAELSARFKAPLLVAIACLGIMILTPVLFGLALPHAGIGKLGPGVALGLMMYLAAPPIMASTAFAALLRLDTALTLALLIVCTALTPLLAPVIVSYFAGGALNLDVTQLVLRLLAILGGAFLAASLLRYLLGNEKIAANKGSIDGINALLLFLFGVTAMDGVTAKAINEPLLIAKLAGLAFALAIGIYVLTTLIFWRQGLKKSLALGFSSAHRNMGVMIAAAGSGLPELTWIYFAVAQFPIYLLPALAAPVVHRLMDRRLPGDK
jgi:predicted Na+-dependent transporter